MGKLEKNIYFLEKEMSEYKRTIQVLAAMVLIYGIACLVPKDQILEYAKLALPLVGGFVTGYIAAKGTGNDLSGN
jgi:hypothetical protein